MRHIFALMLAILAIPVMATAAAACTTGPQAVDLNRSGNSLQGGREDLWKAVRYTLTRDGDAVGVHVEYQKQKHLLCLGEICHGLTGTPWAWDNRGRLNEWHTTIRYSRIPLGGADSANMAPFSQDFISGRYNPVSDTLHDLTVRATGRVVFSKPSGGVSCR